MNGTDGYHRGIQGRYLAADDGLEGDDDSGRQKHGTASPGENQEKRKDSKTEAMRQKLRDGGWESPYRLRKHTVEPVFGQIKEARGFRRFLRRGLDNVQGEWALICTVHNLLELAKRTAPAARPPAP